MKVLVDTHAFIWALLADQRLSTKAKHVLAADDSELYYSLASLWEVAIRMKTGKLKAIGSSVAYIRDEMEAYGIQLLPIRYDHLLQIEMLPVHHSDPFDRMLIAQAITESIPILTRDEKFAAYPVRLIW